MTSSIYFLAGGMLAVTVLYVALWIRFRMKRPLFTPEPLQRELPSESGDA